MKVPFKNKKLERFLIGLNVIAAACVAGTFACLYGFYEPVLRPEILFTSQIALLAVFLLTKVIRFFNAESKGQFLRVNWFEIPIFIAFLASVFFSRKGYKDISAETLIHFYIGLYLVIQVVIKLCRTSVNMAATGRGPAKSLIISFLFLIITGAGVLMLPRASTGEPLSFVDALFTSTSATCVTGLIVKDTGGDFTLLGQIVILTLIQLGGLGIVIFGAVLALLLGQAFSVSESVAMQDLLNTRTLNRIGQMIAFIFVGTILIEIAGAVAFMSLWDDVPGRVPGYYNKLFCSIFHSISAFCNAGFSLFSDSVIQYKKSWQVYGVFCPLIILGGLGFGVLYNLADVAADKIKRFTKKIINPKKHFYMEAPKRLSLQTKIVLFASLVLVIGGAVLFYLFEYHITEYYYAKSAAFGDAFFQSVTARTAGFNTVDIGEVKSANKMLLIILMFIGGSPGSTAGGIKTVTFAVIIMTAFAALRKRPEVEMFNRSIRLVIVGRAITVMLLFIFVLFTATFLLSITEAQQGFTLSDIMFESASALGTVGLSTGITPVLTSAGKLIIITLMLIGRLGPLTLLAALTFNLRPAKYNYPDEAVIVG